MKKNFYIILTFLLLSGQSKVMSQICDPNVPVFNVDLSTSADTFWISPDTIRQNNCCGTTPPDRCIEFVVTLNPDAQGIIFDVYSGALPPGALFYQINCGTPTPVGSAICLSGAGPHIITFCKPGKNVNEYVIYSVPNPGVSNPIVINEGCTGTIYTWGYDDTTITWNSVYPGNYGDYNNYLSCTEDCDTNFVSAQPGYPPYIDFEVCGLPLGGCDSMLVCDTARVIFNSTLLANITPDTPAICYGDTGIILNATGSGGAPPYNYNWSTGENTQNIFVDTAGTYIVEISDSTNCPSAFDTVTVITVDTTIIVNAGMDTTLCKNIDSYQLNGSVIGVPGGYWTGGNGIFSPSNDSLNAEYSPTQNEINNGSLTLYLISQNAGSCGADTDSVTLYFTSFNANINLNVVNVSCYGNNDAYAYVSVNGANAPYTIIWDTIATNIDTVQNLAPGSYQLIIIDRFGCDSIIPFNVIEPSPLNDTAFIKDALCSGSNTGSIDLTVNGGTMPYIYQWSSGDSTEDISNLFAGTYIIKIIDSNNCTIQDTFTVNEPPPLTSTISTSNTLCKGDSNGQASISVLGGTAPYQILWSTNDTTQSISNLVSGVYIANVTDANGCTLIDTAIINDPPALQINSVVSMLTCFNSNDGSIDITVTGGTPPYSYNWSNGANSEDINNLDTGIFIVNVSDANACNISDTFQINQPLPLTDTMFITNITCNGLNDGSIDLSVSGGTAPYSYFWSNGLSFEDISNLDANTYYVTITDSNGCTLQDSAVIIEPAPLNAIIDSSKDILCFNSCNGSAYGNASGGTSPYQFYWLNNVGDTIVISQNISNICAGTYILSVNDSNGCSNDTNITIYQPADIYGNIVRNGESCNGCCDGTAVVYVGGGTPSYNIQWYDDNNNLIATGTNASNLCDSVIYTVVITDSNGCTDTLLSSLDANIIIFYPCDGSCAKIKSIVSGGFSPYTFQWLDSNNNVISLNDSITCAANGNYTLIVVDSLNDTLFKTITINTPYPLNSSICNIINNDCYSNCTGEASVCVSGGIQPYFFQWSNGDISSTANNLCSGTHYVNITDDSSCSISDSVVISEPPPISDSIIKQNVSCYGFSDGYIDLTVFGGTPPYQFLWSNSDTSEDINNIPVGIYSVQITDFNSCVFYDTVQISQPSQLLLSYSIANVSCYGGNDGSIDISLTGGTLPYSYLWSTGDTSEDLISISSGIYFVDISDSNNCILSDTFQINEPLPLRDSLNFSKVTCFGGNDGSIDLSVSGGTYPYFYNWSTGDTTQDISSLSSGMYYVTITDSNFCSITDSIFVNESPKITVLLSPDDTICPGDSTTIFAVASGGNGNYVFLWSIPSNFDSSIVVSPSQNTNYNLVVSDSAGCLSDTASITVYVRNLYPDSLILGSTGNICLGDSTSIFANYNGSITNIVLTWNNGLGTGEGPFIVSPSDTTTYVVTATEQNCGNYISDSITIYVYPIPFITLPLEIKSGCLPLNITLYDSLYPSFQHIWDLGNGIQLTGNPVNYTYNSDGIYDITLTLTSPFGCSYTTTSNSSVTVFPLPQSSFVANPSETDMQNPSINFDNQSIGSISYFWNFGDNDTSSYENPVHTYSDTGKYLVQLIATNQFNCSDTSFNYVIITPYYTLEIPNAFTPNPNGPSGGEYDINSLNNDVFYPITQYVKEFKMNIFNRWGELIFESNDINKGWDGYYRGELAQQGVYVWKIYIKYVDGKEINKVGTVTLLR